MKYVVIMESKVVLQYVLNYAPEWAAEAEWEPKGKPFVDEDHSGVSFLCGEEGYLFFFDSLDSARQAVQKFIKGHSYRDEAVAWTGADICTQHAQDFEDNYCGDGYDITIDKVFYIKPWNMIP